MFVSCVVLLVISTFILDPAEAPTACWSRTGRHKAASSSPAFSACCFWRSNASNAGAGGGSPEWLAVMLGMLANIFYVATGRTALVIIPVLLVLFAAKNLSGRGIAVLFACVIAVAASLVGCRRPICATARSNFGPSYQQYEDDQRQHVIGRARRILQEVADHYPTGADDRTRHRIHRRVVRASAPSVREDRLAPARLTNNPHNQTFAVAIQLGLVGALVLWAMWIAHLSAVPRQRARGMDRARHCRAEYRRLAVQLASCSISTRAGSTCWASALPAVWR